MCAFIGLNYSNSRTHGSHTHKSSMVHEACGLPITTLYRWKCF